MTSSRRAALRALGLAAALLGWSEVARGAPADEQVRFAAVDVFVDAGSASLAAYQVEIAYDRTACALAGVEGGDGPFTREPYYDPKGLTAGRIVLADFTTGAPGRGRIRVARVHLELRGDPKLAARVVTAAAAGGAKIVAQVALVPFERSEGR